MGVVLAFSVRESWEVRNPAKAPGKPQPKKKKKKPSALAEKDDLVCQLLRDLIDLRVGSDTD